MKVKIKTRKTSAVREERGDYMDEYYGMEAFKSLSRGVIAELEKNGVIPKGSFTDKDFEEDTDEEVIEEVEVDDDVIYKKAKQIQYLDRLIKARQEALLKLDKAIQGKQCKTPSTKDLMGFCDDLIRVSKGKGKEKPK